MASPTPSPAAAPPATDSASTTAVTSPVSPDSTSMASRLSTVSLSDVKAYILAYQELGSADSANLGSSPPAQVSPLPRTNAATTAPAASQESGAGSTTASSSSSSTVPKPTHKSSLSFNANFEIPGASSQQPTIYTPLAPPPRPRRRRPGSVSLAPDDDSLPARASPSPNSTVDSATTNAAAVAAAAASQPNSAPAPSADTPSSHADHKSRPHEQSVASASPAVGTAAAASGGTAASPATAAEPNRGPPPRPPKMRVTLPIGSPIRPMSPSPTEDATKDKEYLAPKPISLAKPAASSFALPKSGYYAQFTPLPAPDRRPSYGSIKPSDTSATSSSTFQGDRIRGTAVDLSVEAAAQDKGKGAKGEGGGSSSGFGKIGLGLFNRRPSATKSTEGANGNENDGEAAPPSKSPASGAISLLASATGAVKASLSRPGSSVGLTSESAAAASSGKSPRGGKVLSISEPVEGSFQSSSPLRETVDLPSVTSVSNGGLDLGLDFEPVPTASSLLKPVHLSTTPQLGQNSTFNPLASRKGSLSSVAAASSNVHGFAPSQQQRPPLNQEQEDDPVDEDGQAMAKEGDALFVSVRAAAPSSPGLGFDRRAAARDDEPSETATSRSVSQTPSGLPTPISEFPGKLEVPGGGSSTVSSSPIVGRGSIGKLSTPPVSSSAHFAASLRERESLTNLSLMAVENGGSIGSSAAPSLRGVGTPAGAGHGTGSRLHPSHSVEDFGAERNRPESASTVRSAVTATEQIDTPAVASLEVHGASGPTRNLAGKSGPAHVARAKQGSADTTATTTATASMYSPSRGGLVTSRSSSNGGTSTRTFPSSPNGGGHPGERGLSEHHHDEEIGSILTSTAGTEDLSGMDASGTLLTSSSSSAELADPRQPPPGAYAIHPPTMLQLFEASRCVIYDENGRQLRFGDVFKHQRTLVCFLRHWWCGFCQEFARSLKEIDPEPLARAGLGLVVIGQGDWHVTKAYKSVMQVPFPMYADPSRQVYKALGMTLRTNDAGPACAKPGYAKSGMTKAIVVAIKKGLFDMPLRAPGDMKLLGGEFILGPGLQCSFVHRMQTTRGHLDVPRILNQAGIDLSQYPPSTTSSSGAPSKEQLQQEKQRSSSTKEKSLPTRPQSVNSTASRTGFMSRKSKNKLRKTSASNANLSEEIRQLGERERERRTTGPSSYKAPPLPGAVSPLPVLPRLSDTVDSYATARSGGLSLPGALRGNHSSATLDAEAREAGAGTRSWGRGMRHNSTTVLEDRFGTTKSLGTPRSPLLGNDAGAGSGRITPTQDSVLKKTSSSTLSKSSSRPQLIDPNAPRPVSKDGPKNGRSRDKPPVTKITSFAQRDLMDAALRPMSREAASTSTSSPSSSAVHGGSANGSVSVSRSASTASSPGPKHVQFPRSREASGASTTDSGGVSVRSVAESVRAGGDATAAAAAAQAGVPAVRLETSSPPPPTGTSSSASSAGGAPLPQVSPVLSAMSGTFGPDASVVRQSAASYGDAEDVSVHHKTTVDSMNGSVVGTPPMLSSASASRDNLAKHLTAGGGSSPQITAAPYNNGLVESPTSPLASSEGDASPSGLTGLSRSSTFNGKRDVAVAESKKPADKFDDEEEDDDDDDEYRQRNGGNHAAMGSFLDDLQEIDGLVIRTPSPEHMQQRGPGFRRGSRTYISDEEDDEEEEEEEEDESEESDEDEYRRQQARKQSERPPSRQSSVRATPIEEEGEDGDSDDSDVLGSRSSSRAMRATPELPLSRSSSTGWLSAPRPPVASQIIEEEEEDEGTADSHHSVGEDAAGRRSYSGAVISHSRGSSYERNVFGDSGPNSAGMHSDSSAGSAERLRRSTQGPGIGAVYMVDSSQRPLHSDNQAAFEDDEISIVSDANEVRGEESDSDERDSAFDATPRERGDMDSFDDRSTIGSAGTSNSNSPSPNGSVGRTGSTRARSSLPPQPPQPLQPPPLPVSAPAPMPSRFHRLGPLASAGPRTRLSAFNEEDEEDALEEQDEEEEDDIDEQGSFSSSRRGYRRDAGYSDQADDGDDDDDDDDRDDDNRTETVHGRDHQAYLRRVQQSQQQQQAQESQQQQRRQARLDEDEDEEDSEEDDDDDEEDDDEDDQNEAPWA